VNKLASQAGRVALIFGMVNGGWAAHSQSVPGQPASQRVATISFAAAVMQTNEAKRDFAALQNKFAPREKQLESLSREIDDLRKQINELKEHLSDSELGARTLALTTKQKQLERAEEDYRNDSQSDGQGAFQRIAQKVFEFLQTYANEHGYTMVVDRGNETTPTVLYATQDADITMRVVSAYDAKSGIPAPAPGGANSQSPGEASQNGP